MVRWYNVFFPFDGLFPRSFSNDLQRPYGDEWLANVLTQFWNIEIFLPWCFASNYPFGFALLKLSTICNLKIPSQVFSRKNLATEKFWYVHAVFFQLNTLNMGFRFIFPAVVGFISKKIIKAEKVLNVFGVIWGSSCATKLPFWNRPLFEWTCGLCQVLKK